MSFDIHLSEWINWWELERENQILRCWPAEYTASWWGEIVCAKRSLLSSMTLGRAMMNAQTKLARNFGNFWISNTHITEFSIISSLISHFNFGKKKNKQRLATLQMDNLNLLYGSASQGLGTTEFTNLIGWNLLKYVNVHHVLFFLLNNLWKCQKAWWHKKKWRGRANFGRFNLISVRKQMSAKQLH